MSGYYSSMRASGGMDIESLPGYQTKAQAQELSVEDIDALKNGHDGYPIKAVQDDGLAQLEQLKVAFELSKTDGVKGSTRAIFNQAFALARKLGLESFWDGKYGTALAGEIKREGTIAKVADKKTYDKITGQDTPIPNNGKPINVADYLVPKSFSIIPEQYRSQIAPTPPTVPSVISLYQQAQDAKGIKYGGLPFQSGI